MVTKTNYPGVYVSEESKLSLSIGESETAVPVLLTDADLNGDVVQEIQSWVDVEPLFKSFKDVTTLNGDASTLKSDMKLYAALRSYFDNGGGRCYVGKFASGDTSGALLGKAIAAKDDITLLVQAGLEQAKFQQIESQFPNLFAIMDTSVLSTIETPSAKENRAVYYPNLIAPAYFTGKDNKPVPATISASAAVAGIYCRTDHERGVWKAPANVALAGGLRPEVNVTDAIQGKWNDLASPAINMIRTFRNGSTLVWGARTLDTSPAWRYVPVRRLFNAAEKDIKAAMRPAVFEPNVPATWEVVRAAIDNYLHKLWQQGALFGNKPEEAYFVRVGKNITMTEEEIQQGKMIVRVGIAAVRPAEFIILEFSQSTASAA